MLNLLISLYLAAIFKHCTEVRFATFFSGGFTTIAVINPPERKLEKRTTVHWYVSSNQLNLIGLGLLGMILLRIFHMY